MSNRPSNLAPSKTSGCVYSASSHPQYVVPCRKLGEKRSRCLVCCAHDSTGLAEGSYALSRVRCCGRAVVAIFCRHLSDNWQFSCPNLSRHGTNEKEESTAMVVPNQANYLTDPGSWVAGLFVLLHVSFTIFAVIPRRRNRVMTCQCALGALAEESIIYGDVRDISVAIR